MTKKFYQFERLIMWQKAVDWTDEIMAMTEEFPPQFQFSLGEQLRWAALSVPTNIAEGTGRNSL